MATRKQFHKLVMTGAGPIGRGQNTVGGKVIGDYLEGMSRILVIEMPKIEKKPKKSKPTAKAAGEDAVRTQQAVTAGV